jgi:cyclopropane fatty-acyl-phospholipid synthase-like methyltransferase
VRATGSTLRQPQVDLANERITQAGLADRGWVQARDRREVDGPAGHDAPACVGMFDYAGAAL